MHSIPGILLLIAGIVGALESQPTYFPRIAWVLVAIAGLLMVLPI